jgi:hypothetical protein
MTRRHDEPDRSDPAVRAAARLAEARTHERRNRMLAAVTLVLVGLHAVCAAEPITGRGGATVGAIVGALLLTALAVAVWPYTWSKAETTHRRLESIWHEVRTDAARRVEWDRYAAWAEARDGSVRLILLRCAPTGPQLGGAPSPYSTTFRHGIDAENITHAVAAMEALRETAANLELEAEQRVHQARLDVIDHAAEAAVEAGEQQARRELAAQEVTERRAQADAVARALRRS